MIYLILAAGLAGVLMVGTIQFQHARNTSLKKDLTTMQMQRDSAMGANKTLTKSIGDVRQQCEDVRLKIEAYQELNKKKQAKAATTLERVPIMDATAIQTLSARALAPLGKTPEEQCSNATTILRDLAKEMNK